MIKNYRSEIDGLRSLAVIGVIFYHAEIMIQSFRFFPGGFLGVDLFFVISGYLITSLILKEYQINNKFSFKNFYKRRAKRLVPALLLVITVSSIFSYLFLLPVHYEEFIKSVLSSIFFFSNFFFHFSGQAYGAQALSQIPLLHTWSLSIEEQFYLLYPIFLIGIMIFLKKKVISILIIGIIFSLIFASIINLNHQSFNFYMLPSRAWELLVGALLATNNNRFIIGKNEKIKGAFAILGYLIILFSFSFFDNTNNHPTYLTLFPIFGAYLILQDTNKKSFLNKFLSIKILTNLGLISYSLYLWHHPIFSFAKIIGVVEKDLFIKVCLIILSLILATFTYKYVEKPFREKKKETLRFSKINILAIGSVLVTASLYVSIDFQKKQYPNIIHNLHEKTWLTTKSYLRPCFQRKTFFCSFNEKNDNPTIFLVGDSIMASIQEELKDILIIKDFNFIPMTNAGCDFIEIDNNSRSGCNQKIHDNRIKKIFNKDEAIIILHLNYTTKFKEKTLKDFSQRVKEYLNKNYKIILVYPVPQMKKNVSYQIQNNYKNNISPIEIVSINFKEYLKDSKKVFNLFDSISHKNLFKIYPHKKFCNNYLVNKCVANTYENVFFTDLAHLSKKGSRLISMDLIKIIDNIY